MDAGKIGSRPGATGKTGDSHTRLAVVVSHPTQYYSPWFRWVTSNTKIQLKTFFLWDFGVSDKFDPEFQTTVKWDVDLLSGYEFEFVKNVAAHPGPEHFSGFENPDLPSRLKAWKPDALLVFGYKWRTHIQAIIWARLNSVPIIFRGDSHLIGRSSPGLGMALPLRILFSQIAICLYVGAANRDYYQAFGVPSRKLIFAPHSIDGSLYNPSNPANVAKAHSHRERIGAREGSTVILFAGKLVDRKQPLALLQSYLRLQPKDSHLVFVGDGEQKSRLQAAVTEVGTERQHIHFLPFANQTEMPALLLMADLFALPSVGYETWGLAVNEAMHMNVPCLVSNRVGCQRDLVIPGETGWVFEAADPSALDRQLALALAEISSVGRRREIARNVRQKIAGYTYEQTTEGLLHALSLVDA